ncbi:nucleotidyltransferase [Bacteroides thetaiotaomicron]|uniref:nucleotidyltransferase domain-containing protein n=1 Tax=Bacteroides thetaiotaomicron TaxID=818 RepID=UPI00216513B2|nr:nucleotidyltransferase [Bacteroides thetaiotaomicron]MCS2713643.1 nucleotidyltransferase [Bacteroides thetaiotaomicron]MCS2873843.1 nucleotidyltransferase [Bacteroides thetaiotaomicron]
MLTQEEKKQFSEILETLGKTLDITETQYNAAVSSYGAVGEWLARPESSLAPYKPVIRPQGSFMLGTMIKPVCEDDDLDIDLVCELTGKNPQWAQYHLKQAVGNRLKANETYKNMLDEEGRRCWTLMYSDSANYHMDILPSLVCNGYDTVLEKAFSATALDKNYESLAIRITDNQQNNYYTDTVAENWMKSNPFGYGGWFFNAADVSTLRKSMMLSEAVNPVPKHSKEKLPLQRVVQILKRHRDMMFNGDEHKPISIIITTLASRAYDKETSIIDALTNVVANMSNYIESRYDPNTGKVVKWIPNPVNPEENFADKWVEYPQREKNFYRWLDQVESDIQAIVQKRGLQYIAEAMKKPFGEQAVTKTFSTLGDRNRNLRESGVLKMAAGTGILSSVGSVTTAAHNFHGND